MTKIQLAKWIVEKCHERRKRPCFMCSRGVDNIIFNSCIGMAEKNSDFCVQKIAEELRNAEKERYGKNNETTLG